VVFASDTSLLTSAVVVAMAPADSHKSIVFSMAGMSASPRQAVLEEFMAFLTGEEAAAIFVRCGFTPLVREDREKG